MKWTNSEISFLQENYSKMTCIELSSKIGRSKPSILSYIYDNRDKLKLPCGGGYYWNRITFDKTPSTTLSYILGVLYGDGWVYYYPYRYVIGLNTTDNEFAECFRVALAKIGLHPSRIYTMKRAQENWNDQFRVQAFSKPFYEWFKNLTFDKVHNLLQTPEMKREFIRGFYESEGSLCQSKGYFRVTITNTDMKLLNFVRKILEELGFCFYIYTHKQRPKNWAAVSYLGIFRPENIKRFLVEINPCISRKSLMMVTKK